MIFIFKYAYTMGAVGPKLNLIFYRICIYTECSEPPAKQMASEARTIDIASYSV